MRVFVTDGDNRASLAVTRSLGRLGHEVIVGEKHMPSLAQTSQYCADRVVYPDPVSASDRFVEFLAAIARDRRVDVLLPVADITTMLVTAHRDTFDAACAIPFAPAEVIQRAANKVGVIEAARRLGVPVPQSVIVTGPECIPEPTFDYPIVIKPHRSRLLTAEGWVSTSVSYASNRDELILDLTSRPLYEFPVMLQERVAGPGLGVFALYYEGKPVALFSHRRVRERPPWGGVSVLSESVPMCPRVRDYATRLLEDLQWTGVAMVEFKGDVRDGLPKLMEINGRFWGSLQLAIDAGVDFPALLVQSVTSGQFAPQPEYRPGVRSRWLWGDFDSLLLRLFGRKRSGAMPESRPKAFLDFMKFVGRDLHYDNPKRHDVKPWFFETYRRFHLPARNGTRVAGILPDVPVGTPRAAVRHFDLSLRARIAVRLEDVGLDEAEWDALAMKSDTRSVFQTYQWARSWLTTYGDRVRPLFVTVFNRAGISAVAPFVVEERSSRERVVRFLGDGRADYCDILTSDAKPNAIQAIVDALRAQDEWDVLELNNIPAHSRTLELLRSVCSRAGYLLLASEQFACPTLLIHGHEASAREIYNKQSLRRRQNYFERQGRLMFRDLSHARDIEPYLDAFFAQHIARWRSSGTPSLFTSARNQVFYRNLTAALDGTGRLLFSVVEFNDRPIAFHYGFDYTGTVTWYKPSFDVEHAAHSPGMVMVRHLIGYALERKRRELDFTVGDETFKRRFTNSSRKTVMVQVFRESSRYLIERSRRTLAATMRHLSR
jgi:CelD/BcsL family acetyltransferase involved in cellulose biosynthesis/predicted ATP-grasp superfamily ATP-dependent carboligase